jgi:membrane-associated phospholipid phosphatase
MHAEDVKIEMPIAYGWLSAFAYWVSQIGSPPLTGAAAALLIGFGSATAHGWQWTGFYLVATILLPCLYIIWLVRRGQVSDFHLPIREERIRPLIFSLVTALLTWGIAQSAAAPTPLRMLAAVNGIQAISFFLITLRWKISLHTATAAILAHLALAFLGLGALPLTVSVPLIAWSRVYLQRHTLAQTVAGAGLGVAILTPLLFWYA